jgi:hypothetical protein
MMLNRLFLLCFLFFSYSPPIFTMETEGEDSEAACPQRKKARKAPTARNLYNSSVFFKMSRTKLELFLKCSRCFYLDCKLGIKRPEGYPFTLNNTVDALLKREFDLYRTRREPHPLCLKQHVTAIPYDHSDLEKWRDSLHHGVQYKVPETNIILYGGLDDVWIDQDTNELIVVDYKATSKEGAVSIDADWQIDYKHQVEIYQWLLRQNGFSVSETAYFVYCNASRSRDTFDARLDFDISLISYKGDTSWIAGAISDVYRCLQDEIPPLPSLHCPYCNYIGKMLRVHTPSHDEVTQYPELEEPT